MTKALTICLAFFATMSIAQKAELLTNEEIWYSRTFSSDYVAGLNSMNDGRHYTVLEQKDNVQVINKYSYKTGTCVSTLVNGKNLFVDGQSRSPVTISSYSFNSDETKIIIATEEESIYRYSSKANYFLYDLKSGQFAPLSDPSKGKQRLATISPDGRKAAFVRKNNIFWVDLDTKVENQITKDGVVNEVINGATDWVYEEEFAVVQGFQWSPNSDKILFMRFDESQVREFNMALFQGGLYPSDNKFKYPKAGENNSYVTLHQFELVSGGTEEVPVPLANEGDFYIPRFGWTHNPNEVWYMAMNRLQNQKVIYKLNMSGLRAPQNPLRPIEIYREESKTYIEIGNDLNFLPSGNGFVLTSTRSGYNHIYRYDMNGKQLNQLTSGNWDVISIYGIDKKRNRVIFSSAKAGPTQQEVWATALKGKSKLLRLSPTGGWNDADFSTTFDYFINTHTTANDPGSISLHNAHGKVIKVLKDNAQLKANMANYAIQQKEFLTIPTDSGHTLNAWMIKPPGFQDSTAYPVLLTIYGGPGYNTVTDSWGGRNYLWHQLLAQEGYVVVSVDPRGTERRGSDFKHATYGQMGKLETEDMISTAKWLKEQPWIDGSRIGVQGWSYGGYMSSLCLMKGNEFFKSAIAVAPVTNWRYYDSIYTERYMGIPQKNPAGYDKNSPINFVSELKGSYLLVHGTADDNVHWQNTAEMINALVKKNKQFDLFIYPDRNHGIYGGTTRLHLYDKMTSFLRDNL